jgi:hypothetical protein
MTDRDLLIVTLLVAILAIVAAGMTEILARLRPRIVYVYGGTKPDEAEEAGGAIPIKKNARNQEAAGAS